jgi:hypothetical protein
MAARISAPNPSTCGKTHGSAEMTFSPNGKHLTGRMMDINWGWELEWDGEKISELRFERDTPQIWDGSTHFPSFNRLDELSRFPLFHTQES